MYILVAVTDVAAADDDFEISGHDIDDRYLTYDLNEWDDYAIETAVQIGERVEDTEVVTVTVGPERSEETIRQALAKGADRAIRVWDEDLAGTGLLDPVTKAHVLAGVVEDESPDLVLTGVQSGDDAYGATGVALAELVDYQWGAVVNDLDLGADPGQATVASVHRELEGGLQEQTEVQLPAVFTIQTGINEPRYASLRGIRNAQSKPLEVNTFEDIGLTGAVLEHSLERTALYEPETETDATFFDGDSADQASSLGELLLEKGVVEG